MNAEQKKRTRSAEAADRGYDIARDTLRFLHDFPHETVAGVIALATGVALIFFAFKTVRYGHTLSKLSQDLASDATVLHDYMYWWALGITALEASSLIMMALSAHKDWAAHRAKQSVLSKLYPLVTLVFVGMVVGVVVIFTKPEIDYAQLAVLILLAMFFQTIVWVLTLTWRDVQHAADRKKQKAEKAQRDAETATSPP